MENLTWHLTQAQINFKATQDLSSYRIGILLFWSNPVYWVWRPSLSHKASEGHINGRVELPERGERWAKRKTTKIAHRCHDSARVSLSVVGPSQKCLSSPRTPLTGQVSVGFAFEVLGNPSYERHFVDERNADIFTKRTKPKLS